MNRAKRMICALLAGVLLCGALSAAVPRMGSTTRAAQEADVPSVPIAAGEVVPYDIQVGAHIRLEAVTAPQADASSSSADGSAEIGSGTAEQTDVSAAWQSDAPEIAAVNSDGLVTALAEGTATITSTAGGAVMTCVLTVSGYAVTGITLTSASDAMHIGETQKLTADIQPEQAADTALTWLSSDTDVLTVADDGTVTAVGEGSAEIRAQAPNGCAGSCTISVTGYALENIIMWPETAQLRVGQTKQLHVSAQPEQAQTGVLRWESDHPDIASVDQNGLVTAAAQGTATVTVRTEDGHEAACDITVSPNYVITGISLDHTALVLTAGKSSKLSASVMPSQLAGTQISWTSSNAAVARVSGGTVTGVKKGTAVITASAGGFRATCHVTVKAKSSASSGGTGGGTSGGSNSGKKPSSSSKKPVSGALNRTAWSKNSTAGSGGMLYLPGSLVSSSSVRPYTMPRYVPSAAFLTIDTDLGTETESILTELSLTGVSATFFVPIDDLYAHDDMLRHIAGSGHSIGLLLTRAQAADGANAVQLLDAANETLSVITGTPTRLVRVAGGSAGAVSKQALSSLQAGGYRLWDWNDAARETSLSADQSYQSVAAALNATGTVTVRFGSSAQTTAVLRQLLPYIKYCGIPVRALGAGDTPVCQIS